MRRVIVPFALIICAMAPPAFAASYYADIRPVIERKCVMCHSESSVSFSFEDPERTYAYREAIASAVAGRRMPPWLAEGGHQTYRGDISLTARRSSDCSVTGRQTAFRKAWRASASRRRPWTHRFPQT